MNRGHHIDVGGMAVAGFPGTAKSMFQEGIRIPPVKWFAGGVEQRGVLDLILLNVRFPRAQLGDFRAQLASCITAEQRLRALAARHGLEALESAMAATKERSERLMRAAIAEVPDGVYRFANLADDDGVGDIPYRVAVEITIAGDEARDRLHRLERAGRGPDQLQLRQHRRLVLQRLPAHAGRRASPSTTAASTRSRSTSRAARS